jgi:hypothetical protein
MNPLENEIDLLKKSAIAEILRKSSWTIEDFDWLISLYSTWEKKSVNGVCELRNILPWDFLTDFAFDTRTPEAYAKILQDLLCETRNDGITKPKGIICPIESDPHFYTIYLDVIELNG